MKKISLIPIGSGLASIVFLPLLAAKCVDTNSQSKENTKQSLHSAIKTTELGELPRKYLTQLQAQGCFPINVAFFSLSFNLLQLKR